MKKTFDGAPACIFAISGALNEKNRSKMITKKMPTNNNIYIRITYTLRILRKFNAPKCISNSV